MYLGACSLVYQGLIGIIFKCFLNLDTKSQIGGKEKNGELLAFVWTDKEQSRNKLHGH